jgi:hypothetical protein
MFSFVILFILQSYKTNKEYKNKNYLFYILHLLLVVIS